jgi:hypothetical protein
LKTIPAKGIDSRREPVDEEGCLPQRVALGGRDDKESGLGILQEGVRLIRPLPEPAEHRVQGGDEGLGIPQQVAAEEPRHDPDGQRHTRAECLEIGLPGCLRRRHQQADEPAVEERSEALGGIEEVQAERDGGVSTMMRSHRSSASTAARSWPSFSIAMYSCVPANELDTAT